MRKPTTGTLAVAVAVAILAAYVGGFFHGRNTGKKEAELLLGFKLEHQNLLILALDRARNEGNQLAARSDMIGRFIILVEKNFPEIWSVRGKLDDSVRWNILMNRNELAKKD